MLNILEEKLWLLCDILLTDESMFTRADIVNVQSEQYWSLENPHIHIIVQHQVRWSSNMWYRIWGAQFVELIFYVGIFIDDH